MDSGVFYRLLYLFIERMYVMSWIAWVIICILFFLQGWSFGIRTKTKKLEKKEKELKELLQDVKNKNNKMLNNFLNVYNKVYNTEGKWTDVDDYILSMWME